jgi:hypothetical protein
MLVIRSQLQDETALRDDARSRGWDSEVARHERVIAGLQHQTERLYETTPRGPTP